MFQNSGTGTASAKGPDLSNWDTSGVTNLQNFMYIVKFLGDSEANANTKMDFASWDLSSITSLYAFTTSNYGYATEVDLSNAAFTNSLTSMQQAFQSYSTATRKVSSITFGSSSDFSGVTTLYGAFRTNNTFTLNLPTNLDLTNLTNAQYMALSSTIETPGYDRFLERLDATWNTALTAGTIEAGGSKYTPGGTAEAAHTSLGVKGWTINDAGPV